MTWLTKWQIPEGCTLPEGHGDYRDRLPLRAEDVAEQLAPVVQVGMAACLDCDVTSKEPSAEGAWSLTAGWQVDPGPHRGALHATTCSQPVSEGPSMPDQAVCALPAVLGPARAAHQGLHPLTPMRHA